MIRPSNAQLTGECIGDDAARAPPIPIPSTLPQTVDTVEELVNVATSEGTRCIGAAASLRSMSWPRAASLGLTNFLDGRLGRRRRTHCRAAGVFSRALPSLLTLDLSLGRPSGRVYLVAGEVHDRAPIRARSSIREFRTRGRSHGRPRSLPLFTCARRCVASAARVGRGDGDTRGASVFRVPASGRDLVSTGRPRGLDVFPQRRAAVLNRVLTPGSASGRGCRFKTSSVPERFSSRIALRHRMIRKEVLTDEI